jgi:hypothetical protein
MVPVVSRGTKALRARRGQNRYGLGKRLRLYEVGCSIWLYNLSGAKTIGVKPNEGHPFSCRLSDVRDAFIVVTTGLQKHRNGRV